MQAMHQHSRACRTRVRAHVAHVCAPGMSWCWLSGASLHRVAGRRPGWHREQRFSSAGSARSRIPGAPAVLALNLDAAAYASLRSGEARGWGQVRGFGAEGLRKRACANGVGQPTQLRPWGGAAYGAARHASTHASAHASTHAWANTAQVLRGFFLQGCEHGFEALVLCA